MAAKESTSLSNPSISVRKGIAWGFSEAQEDTSTLVLTSPKAYYVDIRFSLEGDPTSGSAFWAFAGTCEHTVSKSLPCTSHGKWAHPIDSQNSDAADEGDMFLLQNGDNVEVGIMQNSKTGNQEMYKEYWTSPYSNLAPCVVIKTLGTWEGIIIRIGDHCQGILQENALRRLYLERWVRSDDEDNGTWLKDWRSNTGADELDVILPCMWAATGRRIVGETIETQGRTWEVIESTGSAGEENQRV